MKSSTFTAHAGHSNAHPLAVDDQTFQQEVLKSDRPVLVDFWAAWCGPCRMIAPVINELAADFHGRAKVVKVDVDTCGDTAVAYDVTSIPTLMIFSEGQVRERIVGVVSRKVLASKLEEYLK